MAILQLADAYEELAKVFKTPILEEKLNSFSTYLIVFSLIVVSEYRDANVNNWWDIWISNTNFRGVG